ncbi:uncharacterized protein LOC110451372 [Mizuhopecten yessoensis]|uniref:uncharacterized protein LOC110451372 n=1 Tax=Mizuhopecten yessoensis TaxID=6573 RepID=UPI000B45C014|nr:uncharacterized protein LOC110451372 [Mizuhopecten yessoensis]
MKVNTTTLQPCILVILYMTLSMVAGNRCSKSLSRIVRQQVKERLLPHYEEFKMKMPDSCPLSPNRDVYMMQEEKVFIESSSRYKCNVCGKAFISQFYIDMHFDNRHPDYIAEGENTICYADYCDITRCDIVSGQKTPDFWDISLCLEDDMTELKERCEGILDQCMPDGLTRKEKEELYRYLHGSVCHFLTCKLYYDGPKKQSADTVMVYSILTTFMMIFFIIYYCIGYHYFYTDTFSDIYDDDDTRPFPVKSIRNSELRQRLMDEKVRKEWKERNDRKINEKFHKMFAEKAESSRE